jgi:hypothetical protein
MISTRGTADPTRFAGEGWFDPIEAGLRDRIRGFIKELVEQELTEALGAGATRAAGRRPLAIGTDIEPSDEAAQPLFGESQELLGVKRVDGG